MIGRPPAKISIVGIQCLYYTVQALFVLVHLGCGCAEHKKKHKKTGRTCPRGRHTRGSFMACEGESLGDLNKVVVYVVDTVLHSAVEGSEVLVPLYD